MTDNARNTAPGFTLIELMIVVVIIGIIAAFAYPNYIEQLKKGRRSDATVAINNVANQLEKYYARCLDYDATLTGTTSHCNTGSGLGFSSSQSPENHYTLMITVPDPPTSYTITANATAGGLQADDRDCQSFTLSSIGVKGSSPNTKCW